MQKRVWQSFKWASLAISLSSITLAFVLINMSGPDVVDNNKQTEKPKIQVKSPIIVERKDGKIVWQLRAEQARQKLDGKMHLSKPILVLYTESEQEIHIVGQQAWFEPLRRNVRFQDEVLVRYNGWSMSTSQMIYNSGKDELHIPGAFNIQGKDIKAQGKNMRLHRTTEQINVDDGIWIEDSSTRWQGVAP